MTETPGAQAQAAKAAARKRAPTKAVAVTMSDVPLNIHDAKLQVMKMVGAVGKTERNTTGEGYDFRGIDQVVNAVFPALVAMGVTISPKCVSKERYSVAVGHKGTNMQGATVTMAYTLTAPDGSTDVWEAPGEAFDYGDKSMSKATSVAYRTAILQGLCLPTHSPDPDSFTYGETPQEQAQPQEQPTYASREEARQAQAGEENQAAQADNEEARAEMWRKAKSLGWTWAKLAARFKSDYGMETSQADKQTLAAFTKLLVDEAKAEEEQAKALAGDVLGARPVDEAQTTRGVL